MRLLEKVNLFSKRSRVQSVYLELVTRWEKINLILNVQSVHLELVTQWEKINYILDVQYYKKPHGYRIGYRQEKDYLLL